MSTKQCTVMTRKHVVQRVFNYGLVKKIQYPVVKGNVMIMRSVNSCFTARTVYFIILARTLNLALEKLIIKKVSNFKNIYTHTNNIQIFISI